MKFKLNEEIKVVGGFATGSSGTIIDYQGRRWWKFIGPHIYVILLDEPPSIIAVKESDLRPNGTVKLTAVK